jgi:hypothetical protein
MFRTSLRSFGVAGIWCIASFCGPGTAQRINEKSPNETFRVFTIGLRVDSTPDFSMLTDAILEGSDVPLRLPAFLPYLDPTDPIAASIVYTDSSSYEVALGWGSDCFSREMRSGAGNCHYGTIRGSSHTLDENAGRRVPLILRGGIHAYFIGFTCGANCDDAAVGWNESGYHYSISLKAGSKKELIKVANSAIAKQQDKISTRGH